MAKRLISVLSVSAVAFCTLLTGCAHKANHGSAATGTFAGTKACQSNAFLQRYGCSLDRVEQAAESDDPDAMYALGYMYYYGIGTVKDKDTAVVWIQRAAGLNQPLAIKAMEIIYHKSFPRQGRATMSKAHLAKKGLPNLEPKGDTLQTGRQQFADAKKQMIPDQIQQARYIKPAAKTVVAKAETQPKTEAKPLAGQSASNWVGADQPAEQVVASHTAEGITEKGKKHYTLQIMASRQIGAIKDFLARYPLGTQASYYHTYYQNKNWYVLIYGDFPSVAQAKQAIQQLPVSVKNMHPWVKSYRTVQKEILQRRVI